MKQLGTFAPKCLLPICGEPFLHLLLKKLHHDGFKGAVVVAGHHAEAVRRAVSEFKYGAMDIEIVTESSGTAPALTSGLRAARSAEVALCLNADTIIDVDFANVRDLHLELHHPITALLTERSDAPNYGRISVSPSGRVTRFAEKSLQTVRESTDDSLATSGDRNLSNCGCYALTVRPVLELLEMHCGTSLEHDFLPAAVQEDTVAAISNGHRFFYDFGTLERYRRLPRFHGSIRRIYDLAS